MKDPVYLFRWIDETTFRRGYSISWERPVQARIIILRLVYIRFALAYNALCRRGGLAGRVRNFPTEKSTDRPGAGATIFKSPVFDSHRKYRDGEKSVSASFCSDE